jgi:ABC-type dipeptide/oligopeptide/nickel transport system ATPase component
MTDLLQIRDLRVRFDGAPTDAVAGVTITVPAGRRVGIIGESGSGKSVTAMSVLRLNGEHSMSYGADSQIVFRGTDLLAQPMAHLDRVRGAEISMIFQDPMSTLNPVFRVGAQIVDVLRTHHPQPRAAARTAVIASLSAVGIRDAERVFERYPHELSGGMQQRVMIAMAIASRPALLIADEATSALDVTVQAAVLETLGTLADDLGMSVLMITHDMGVVARFCDDVYVMNGGEVVEHGPVSELLTRPTHPYTQKLLAAVPRVRPVA